MPPADSEHSSSALPSGFEFSNFRIEKVLGQGGFGITYLAHEKLLDRRVAIKELFPRQYVVRHDRVNVVVRAPAEKAKFAQAKRHFIAEARRIAQFRHENIVRVHHLFEAQQTAYFVMDYVEGVSFAEWIDRHRAPAEEHLRPILFDLLKGLEYIHSHNVLHQDISPENILIDRRGKPVLIDFGSSRGAISSGETGPLEVTRAGYSAIELYVGGKRGPFTDLYALAAVMVHAATGHVPPTALDRRADPAVMLPMVQRCRNRYRQNFLWAIDAALSVQAESRPQNVAQFRRLLEGRSQGKKPRWEFKLPGRALISALACAALLALGIGVWKTVSAWSNGNAGGSEIAVRKGATAGLLPDGYHTGSGMSLVEMPLLESAAKRIFMGASQTRCADYAFYIPGYQFYIPLLDQLPNGAALTEAAKGQYPVVRVSQTKAAAFCEVMTEREIKAGLLPAAAFFRLPTLEEWALAAHTRSGWAHPWGNAWPPLTSNGAAAANLADASLGRIPTLRQLYPTLENYDDGFATTAPVGSFPELRTAEGLLDFGSNIEEWCAEVEGATACARGASWRDADGSLATSSRVDRKDADEAFDWIGFRVVLEMPGAH